MHRDAALALARHFSDTGFLCPTVVADEIHDSLRNGGPTLAEQRAAYPGDALIQTAESTVTVVMHAECRGYRVRVLNDD